MKKLNFFFFFLHIYTVLLVAESMIRTRHSNSERTGFPSPGNRSVYNNHIIIFVSSGFRRRQFRGKRMYRRNVMVRPATIEFRLKRNDDSLTDSGCSPFSHRFITSAISFDSIARVCVNLHLYFSNTSWRKFSRKEKLFYRKIRFDIEQSQYDVLRLVSTMKTACISVITIKTIGLSNNELSHK